MTGEQGKPRPGHMTEKSIIERLLQDFCLLIDSKIKEGEDRKMERRKKDEGGFGARRRRTLIRQKFSLGVSSRKA